MLRMRIWTEESDSQLVRKYSQLSAELSLKSSTLGKGVVTNTNTIKRGQRRMGSPKVSRFLGF